MKYYRIHSKAFVRDRSLEEKVRFGGKRIVYEQLMRLKKQGLVIHGAALRTKTGMMRQWEITDAGREWVKKHEVSS
jgi:DNA-binding PadR family transcriptional regulator